MNLFKNWTLVVLSLAFAIGCTRAEKESSKMSISLPTSQASKKVSSLALTADMVLSHVVINVSGQGIAQPILYTWDICRWCPTVSPQSSFTLDVPQGTGRLIQLLAVYQNKSTSEMAFYYGDSTQDISGATQDVGISISQVGQGPIVSGRVSGRYLTGTDSGPTGMVDILYSPSTSKPGLLLDRGSIVNGWFSLFMLTGASFSYVVRQPDGSSVTMWDGPISLDSPQMNPDEKIVGVAGSPNFDKRVRAYIPVNLRPDYSGSNTATYVPGEAAINVWGYWGAGATGKKVCLDGVTGSSQRLKVYSATIPATPTSFSFSHLINYDLTTPTVAQLMDTTSPYTTIVVQGGATMSGGSCAGITDTAANQFLNFQKVNLQMVDSDGGDNVAGFRGIFVGTTSANSSSPTYLNVSGTDPRTLSGQVLPGVQNVINGLRLFKRVGTEDVYMEAPNCNEVAAAGPGYEGFVLGSSADATIDASGAFSLNSTISAAEASAGVSAVMCPVANGAIVPTGVFLARWMFYSYGGGGGGGMTAGPPTKLRLEAPVAMVDYECRRVRVTKTDANNFETSEGTTNVVVGLSGPSTFYAVGNSTPCMTGQEITSLTIPGGSSSAEFEVMAPYLSGNTSPANNFTITASDNSSTLTSASASVNVRPYGAFTHLFWDMNTSFNVGSCVPVTFKAMGGNGPDPISTYNGTFNVSLSYGGTGIGLYDSNTCTAPIANTSGVYSITLTNGLSTFYMKATATGPYSFTTTIVDGGLTFTNYLGVNVVPSTEPTQLMITADGANSMMLGKCLHYTIQSANDVGTAYPAAGNLSLSSMVMGSGSVMFYTDAACTSSASSPSLDANGTLEIYAKPSLNYSGSSSLTFDFYANLYNTTMYPLTGKTSTQQVVNAAWVVFKYEGTNNTASTPNIDTTTPGNCKAISLALATNSDGTGATVTNYTGSPINVHVALSPTGSVPVQVYASATDCAAGASMVFDGAGAGVGLDFTIATGATDSTQTYYIKSTATAGNPTYLSFTKDTISDMNFSGTYDHAQQVYLTQ